MDSQNKAIRKLEEKLGLVEPDGRRSLSPGARRGAPKHDDDARSEFSVDSNASECAMNDNYFDLRIIDASLNQDLVQQYVGGMSTQNYKEP